MSAQNRKMIRSRCANSGKLTGFFHMLANLRQNLLQLPEKPFIRFIGDFHIIKMVFISRSDNQLVWFSTQNISECGKPMLTGQFPVGFKNGHLTFHPLYSKLGPVIKAWSIMSGTHDHMLGC